MPRQLNIEWKITGWDFHYPSQYIRDDNISTNLVGLKIEQRVASGLLLCLESLVTNARQFFFQLFIYLTEINTGEREVTIIIYTYLRIFHFDIICWGKRYAFVEIVIC